MITIDTVPDITRITAALGNLGDQAPKAASRALNRIATTANARAAREIAKDLKLKVRDAKGNLRIIRSTYSILESRVVAKGPRIPLSTFNANKRTRGISYDLGQGRKTIIGGFRSYVYAPVTGVPHFGVFVRNGPKVMMTKGRYEGKFRQRIYERFGPSIPRVFAQARVQTALRQVIAERWTTEITAQMNAVITRAIK